MSQAPLKYQMKTYLQPISVSSTASACRRCSLEFLFLIPDLQDFRRNERKCRGIRKITYHRPTIRRATHVAFRAGSVLGLMIHSHGVLGVSALYVMLEHVRMSAKFAPGAT